VVAALQVAVPELLPSQEDRGAAMFRSACAACHTIGGGRLVGPDLQGLHERRSELWIIAFVQRSQQVIASGDPVATALFKEYQEIVMPDQPFSDDEVREILAYIRRTKAFGAAPAAATAAVEVTGSTEEQVQLGRELFQGTTRLANGGPSCTSCHDVTDAAITGGGVLARELTTVVSRLGAPGVRAMIANPPFPVMQRAYRDHPLIEAEVTALVQFLGLVGAEQALHQPRGFGPRLFAAGVGGSVLLLLLYSLVWRRRLKGSVNQGIYDRQITST
jgi:mono/diheme cytochrome c family protein